MPGFIIVSIADYVRTKRMQTETQLNRSEYYSEETKLIVNGEFAEGAKEDWRNRFVWF